MVCDAFDLQGSKEAFGDGIVETVAAGTHAGLHVASFEKFAVPAASILAVVVRVVQRAGGRPARGRGGVKLVFRVTAGIIRVTPGADSQAFHNRRAHASGSMDSQHGTAGRA